MKESRQRAILRILGRRKVHNQEELLKYLEKEGIKATQATISRDLAQMKIVKMHNPEDDTAFFSVPSDSLQVVPDIIHSVSGIVSIDFSGCLCVVKTSPGYANMIGAVIDTKCGELVMGTVAGDDTLLVILKQNVTSDDFKIHLMEKIPGAESKFV